MEKLFEKILEGKFDLETMLQSLFPIEVKVKFYGKKEGKFWISIEPIKPQPQPQPKKEAEE
jgi:hypothetical protein